jgi:hypothetical protein
MDGMSLIKRIDFQQKRSVRREPHPPGFRRTEAISNSVVGAVEAGGNGFGWGVGDADGAGAAVGGQKGGPTVG